MEPLNQEDKQRIILQHRIRLRQVKPPPESRAMMWWMTLTLGGAVLAAILIFPHYCIRVIASGRTAIAWTGSRDRAIVALTLDDGPDPVYTPQILKVLAAEHVKATFFVVGDRVVKYPEIVDEICAAGHEIGNHTGSWRRTLFLDAKEFAEDLDVAAARVESVPMCKKVFPSSGNLDPACPITDRAPKGVSLRFRLSLCLRSRAATIKIYFMGHRAWTETRSNRCDPRFGWRSFPNSRGSSLDYRCGATERT